MLVFPDVPCQIQPVLYDSPNGWQPYGESVSGSVFARVEADRLEMFCTEITIKRDDEKNTVKMLISESECVGHFYCQAGLMLFDGSGNAMLPYPIVKKQIGAECSPFAGGSITWLLSGGSEYDA